MESIKTFSKLSKVDVYGASGGASAAASVKAVLMKGKINIRINFLLINVTINDI